MALMDDKIKQLEKLLAERPRTEDPSLQMANNRIQQILQSAVADPKGPIGQFLLSGTGDPIQRLEALQPTASQREAMEQQARQPRQRQQLFALQGRVNPIPSGVSSDKQRAEDIIKLNPTAVSQIQAKAQEGGALSPLESEVLRNATTTVGAGGLTGAELLDLTAKAKEARKTAILNQIEEGDLSAATAKDVAEAFEGKAAEDTIPLTKNVMTQVQKDLVENASTIRSLKTTSELFDPKFFTMWGKLKLGALNRLDKLNTDLLTPAQSRMVAKGRQLKEGIERIFNAYRKKITGAQASVEELKMLEKGVLNNKLSPTAAAASLLALRMELELEQRVRFALLKDGITELNLDPVSFEKRAQAMKKQMTRVNPEFRRIRGLYEKGLQELRDSNPDMITLSTGSQREIQDTEAAKAELRKILGK